MGATDPATTNQTLALITHRRLTGSNGPLCFMKADFGTTIFLRSNSPGSGRERYRNLTVTGCSSEADRGVSQLQSCK